MDTTGPCQSDKGHAAALSAFRNQGRTAIDLFAFLRRHRVTGTSSPDVLRADDELLAKLSVAVRDST